jgi:hypothetical protein
LTAAILGQSEDTAMTTLTEYHSAKAPWTVPAEIGAVALALLLVLGLSILLVMSGFEADLTAFAG